MKPDRSWLDVAAIGLSEARALAILQEELPQTGAGGVGSGALVGIGDDAAVLPRSAARQAWTIDACIESVHFERSWLSPEDLAHKSLHAAISDLAAMGARPGFVLVQMHLAPWLTASKLRRLAREQAAVCRELRCGLVGGNLTGGERLELVTTALGHLEGRPLLRSGARPGDELWLVGPVGWARLGFWALGRGWGKRRSFERCVQAFRRPRARVHEGRHLVGRAHACLDVSDGLLRDVRRLAQESQVAVVVERTRLQELVDDDVGRAARELGVDPMDTLLDGGEDYALLATGPRERRPRFARVIGRVDGGQGAWLETARGRTPLRGGYQHAAGPSR